MTQNEWLAIAPFLIVAGLALLVIIVDHVLAEATGHHDRSRTSALSPPWS